MVGRIDGSIDGRPIQVHADGHSLTVRLSSLRTIARMRDVWAPLRTMLDVLGDRSKMRITVRVPWLPAVDVHPRPSAVVRWFSTR